MGSIFLGIAERLPFFRISLTTFSDFTETIFLMEKEVQKAILSTILFTQDFIRVTNKELHRAVR
jgi:hypothetical protein